MPVTPRGPAFTGTTGPRPDGREGEFPEVIGSAPMTKPRVNANEAITGVRVNTRVKANDVTIPLDLHSTAETLQLRPWVTAWQIRNLRESGLLGVWRLSGRVFISLSELDSLFERVQQEQRP